MTHSIAERGFNADLRPAVATTAKPYWNPYLVGILLGLVLLATYVVTGRGLGATGAFSSVAT
jgi:hypothetical protein